MDPPILGFGTRLHVRRTDKTSEAAYHPLHEYMTYVEEWYDAHELLHPGTKRRVYLATDESSLINEAINTYVVAYSLIHSVLHMLFARSIPQNEEPSVDLFSSS